VIQKQIDAIQKIYFNQSAAALPAK